jgi:leucyl-tRNA synthetase
VDSSWYFMRYCDPKNTERMVGEGTQYWMPMDQYIGGIEHAILHLLYARFWTKVMRDLGLVKIDEPFTKLLTQGMVLNEAFSRTTTGKQYFWAHDLDIVRDEHSKVLSATSKADGQPVAYEGWTTMSKSKNNGVDPQDLIEKYGADTARLYTMFTAPPEATLEWNDAALEGSHRFLRRVWNFGHKLHAAGIDAGAAGAKLGQVAFGPDSKALRLEIHSVLKQVDYDYQRMQYNTVVSGAMKLLNALEDCKADVAPTLGAAAPALPPEGALAPRGGPAAQAGTGVQEAMREGFGILLRVLYPVTPHIAHALWQQLGFAASQGELLDAPWPRVDQEALMQDEIDLVLQVNGKLRGSVRIPAGASKHEIEKLAVASEAFLQHSGGASAKKVIVVPGRLVNVVT